MSNTKSGVVTVRLLPPPPVLPVPTVTRLFTVTLPPVPVVIDADPVDDEPKFVVVADPLDDENDIVCEPLTLMDTALALVDPAVTHACPVDSMERLAPLGAVIEMVELEPEVPMSVYPAATRFNCGVLTEMLVLAPIPRFVSSFKVDVVPDVDSETVLAVEAVSRLRPL